MPRLSHPQPSFVLYTTFLLLFVAAYTPDAFADDTTGDRRLPGLRAGTRSSPFDPPTDDDSAFITDDGPGLDTGCTFNTDPEHPLMIELLVDRVIGPVNADGTLANANQLIANGIIPATLTLTMPAFDVDVNGSPPPERDDLLFNGQFVGTLNGDNQIWLENSFQIDIRTVHFPSEPPVGQPVVPAVNTVQVNIDVLSTGRWCTAIDWVALTGLNAPLPVLFLNGLSGSATIWDTIWIPGLQSKGLIVHNFPIGGVNFIDANALLVGQAVQELRTRLGVSQVNIVGHSRGGLDARRYITSHNDIHTLIEIGSPNGGTPLANSGCALLPSICELTPLAMTVFNVVNRNNRATTYVSMAGNHDPSGFCAGSCFLLGPDDDWVQVSSAHALAYAQSLEFSSNDQFSRHTQLHQSQAIFDMLLGYLISPPTLLPAPPSAFSIVPASVTSATQIAHANDRRTPNARQTLGARIPKLRTTPSLSEVSGTTGTVAAGVTMTHSVPLRDATAAVFSLLWQTGDLDLVLVAPDGMRIDPTAAAGDPNVDFVATSPIAGLEQETYYLDAPMLGAWGIEVTGTSVPGPSERYRMSVLEDGSSLVFAASTDAPFYPAGGQVVLNGSPTDAGSPILTAAVAAEVSLPDGTVQDLTLFDDGTHSDGAAADGLYGTLFTPPTGQPGLYSAQVSALDTNGSTYSRQALVTFTVGASQSAFNGNFADFGVDTDADGLFDYLRIDIGVSTTVPMDYQVTGDLVDASGVAIQSVATTATLGAGAYTVSLNFDAAAIRQNGVDGPYTLANVVLLETGSVGALPVDVVDSAHTTGSYSVSQFERPQILLTGAISDEGVDTDADGLFDELRVDLGLDLLVSDFYQWSARLVDGGGTEIDFDAGSGSLSQGLTHLLLTFNGQAIGENGVHGPYFIKDLLIFGSTGPNLLKAEVGETQAYLFTQFEGATDVFPPSVDVTLNRTILWPPNHKLVDVVASVTAVDDVDPNPVVALVMIQSSEPDSGMGEGDKPGDIQDADIGTADFEFRLRAERFGNGTGREYAITYAATDAAGNASTATVVVSVPHDLGGIARPSIGFAPTGAQFDPSAATFGLILLGDREVNVGDGMLSFAQPWNALVGNTAGVLHPLQTWQSESNGDGFDDLVMIYSLPEAADLLRRSDSTDGPLALLLRDSGDDFVVPDIMALGPPVPLPEATGVDDIVDSFELKDTELVGGWPNPFGSSVSIRFALHQTTDVRVAVYDARGALVREVTHEVRSPGVQAVRWDGRNMSGDSVSSGVYFIRLEAGTYRGTAKLVRLY